MKAIEFVKVLLLTVWQVISMVVFYPMMFALGLYARITRRDKFLHISRVGGVWIFPAFGKWWLPMFWGFNPFRI